MTPVLPVPRGPMGQLVLLVPQAPLAHVVPLVLTAPMVRMAQLVQLAPVVPQAHLVSLVLTASPPQLALPSAPTRSQRARQQTFLSGSLASVPRRSSQ